VIVACWKWVSTGDERSAGISAADEAALEVALQLAETTGDDDVVVICVGQAESERGLREALAAGAARAVRVDAPDGLESAAAASALAAFARGARWVLCGDVSADRGTGSVPAFLAAELGAAQALGLVAVDLEAARVQGTRRLDGGRREVLAVTAPAVLSVEGAVARLRRASLAAELDARHATIDVEAGPPGPLEQTDAVRPFRPRARECPSPSGDPLNRVRELTATAGTPRHTDVVTLDPPAAADRILAAMRDWGYLDR
jgi:electron transfer flavoprotein beta subunit